MKSPADRELLATAGAAARRAGRLLMRYFGRLKLTQISMKAKNDFVTDLDKRSERLIIAAILKRFPGHAIQAEETGDRQGAPEAIWIIDPLDGTSNYIHQIPIFSVSIGVLVQGERRVGVIYDPVHDELFSASKGRGAFLNGERIRVTKVADLADALLCTGIPFRARDRFDEYMKSFRALSLGSVGLRRGGSAALDLAYVACGRFDAFWEMDLSPWDIAAGALLVEEAGGRITDLWGGDTYMQNGDVLASNGLLHGRMCRITRPIFTRVRKDKRWRSV